MSNSNMVSQVSIREYVERLRRRECGYSHEELRSLDWRGQDLEGCDLRGLDLHGLDMSGANLCDVYLRGADLSEANLSEANLSEANLWKANLRATNLYWADLSEAGLQEANLRAADLRAADLWEASLYAADLRGADLRGASLHAANLCGADLRGADLRGASLSRANLSKANLSDTILDWDKIPYIPNIDAAVLEAIEAGKNLDMSKWHTCKTTHCWAGWVITIAGQHGKALEEQLGTNAAASLICARSGSHPVPNWYADNETALNDIKARAKRKAEQQF